VGSAAHYVLLRFLSKNDSFNQKLFLDPCIPEKAKESEPEMAVRHHFSLTGKWQNSIQVRLLLSPFQSIYRLEDITVTHNWLPQERLFLP